MSLQNGSLPKEIGEQVEHLQSRRLVGLRRTAWIDTALCLLAVLGIGMSLAPDFQRVQTLDYVATDFKTVYASSALFARGGDPYDLRDLATVYQHDGVTQPKTAFGHMPVYPPATLLVLAPLTWMKMGSAALVWFALCLAATALGLTMLLREARAQGLGWGWRVGIVGFAASSPLLGFALDVGNVSVAVAGLAIAAWMLALRPLNARLYGGTSRWVAGNILGGASLALALCLKPHVALWVGIGIVLVAGRTGRWVAGLGAAGFTAAVTASLALLAVRGALRIALRHFATVLSQEQAGGSMSPSSREALPIGARITGLQSLFGLRLTGWVPLLLATLIVLALGTVLLWIARSCRCRMDDRTDALLFVSAVVSVGMIASYHREHDGLALTPVALWACYGLRDALDRRLRISARITAGAASCAVLALLLWGWFSMPASLAASIAQWVRTPWIGDLLQLRQAAVASFCLAVCLVAMTFRTRRPACP